MDTGPKQVDRDMTGAPVNIPNLDNRTM